jgi:iron only hydrogenase large subunit-like protein
LNISRKRKLLSFIFFILFIFLRFSNAAFLGKSLSLRVFLQMGESVICLHPPVEERGRVKADGDPAFRISLKDCLACSGCAITEDDFTLLAQQDPSHVLAALAENPGFAVIVSSMAIANVSAARRWSVGQSFASITAFFAARGSAVVIADSAWQILWRRLLLELFLSNAIPKPLIISRCAAAVIFFERKTQYANHLATIKPFAQLFGAYARSQFPYILQVAACYDRKLETGRFPGDIAGVLAIGEIAEQLPEAGEIDFGGFPGESDVIWLLRKLGEGELIQNESGRTIEYRIGQRSGAWICGEAALRRLCANLDNGKCTYDIVQADLCPSGCASGGGLIRGASPAARQQLVKDTLAIHSSTEFTDPPDLDARFAALHSLDIAAAYASRPPEIAPDRDLTF